MAKTKTKSAKTTNTKDTKLKSKVGSITNTKSGKTTNTKNGNGNNSKSGNSKNNQGTVVQEDKNSTGTKVSDPSAGVSFYSQGINTDSEWYDYITQAAQESLKKAQKENPNAKLYWSQDEKGELHYSVISQEAANRTASKYASNLTEYEGKDGNRYKIGKKEETSPAGDFTSGGYAANNNAGEAATQSSKAILNNMTGQQSQGVALDTTNPFGFLTDRATIQNLLDAATEAAYVQKEKEAKRGLVDAENSAYANTNNAVSEIRKNLAGSAATGANRGSAAATALQSLLGLGQQNNEMVTTGLQNIVDVADQKAAALAANANTAIDTSNNAKNLQSNSATSVYSTDGTMWSELTAALSSLASSLNTDNTNLTMSNNTNATNEAIARLETAATKYAADKSANTKSEITYKNK